MQLPILNWGNCMNLKRVLMVVLAAAGLALASCSGLHNSTPCTDCSSNAKLTITLYDTPPTGLNLLSFTLPIAGLSLVPSTGSAVPLAPAVGSVEATRLVTDSALILDAAEVAAATYTTLNVTLGPTTATSNVFVNASGSTITWTTGSGGSCVTGAVCYLPAGAIFTIPLSLNQAFSANQNVWIGLNLNLSNAITTAGGLSVDFSQPKVLSFITTPRIGIPSGSVDTIEDFTGTVTAYSAGSSITVQNGVSGQKITAVLNGNTEYDASPNGSAYTGCSSGTPQSCIKVGSTVSVDSNLSSAGVLTASEVDVLDVTAVDEVEGIIYPTSTTNVYGVILADKVSVSGNAILEAQTTTWGTGIFVTAGTTNNVFCIDTKTLTSQLPNPSGLGFAGLGDILAGQQVRLQVQNVTTGTSGGNTIITATANNVMLRFSRLPGTPSNVGTSGFYFAPPAYVSFLNSNLPAAPVALTYTTTLYDGVTDTPSLANVTTASIRTLYLNNVNPTFAVAKVRVP